MGGLGSGGSKPCPAECQCGKHIKPKGADSPNYVGDAITHKASARRRIRDGAGRFAATLVIVASLLSVMSPTAAHAAVTSPSVTSHTLGDKVLNWAVTQAGCWYSYGSTGGCSHGYDCSGLIYAAALHLGFSVPRTTFGMLAGSAHLYRIPLSWARRGDLLFYGSGHVEIDTGWHHTTFGAQQTGTRIGWHPWSGYWSPTMAMRFR
jgi:cell wall-associated NlpC family hydrolase